MEFQEYPKALYLNGAHKIVADADEETAARADGYDYWADDQERMNAPADAEAAPGPRKTRATKG